VLELLIPERSLTLVNVNLPPEPQGLCWARQSVRHYDGRVVPGRDPMGREHFWLTVAPLEEVEEGTDRWAMERGLVSMTPLRLDLTDVAALQRVRAEHPI
jgi:5'/3'-nucleotidase